MSDRKLSAPPINPDSEPFYAAAAQGRFLIRRCKDCERMHWYPRPVCPFCFGETEWREVEGAGEIYSYSVMRRTDPPFAIAYVTLDAGPTMLTNIVDCDLDKLHIGQRVSLVFKPTDGAPAPCFTPAS